MFPNFCTPFFIQFAEYKYSASTLKKQKKKTFSILFDTTAHMHMHIHLQSRHWIIIVIGKGIKE